MAEELKAPIIRRILERTAFDPEIGSYRVVVIRVEYPKGQFHDIEIPKEEYKPDRVVEYVKEWFETAGKWIGKAVE